MNENDISYKIRGALGPGLLESVYVAALVYELQIAGLSTRTEIALPVVYENQRLDLGFRLDILVNDLVIIEVKSVEQLVDVHHKVVLTYLKLSGKKLGILVNFNTDNISKSIFRKVNKL
jgi:GxxExxY protein